MFHSHISLFAISAQRPRKRAVAKVSGSCRQDDDNEIKGTVEQDGWLIGWLTWPPSSISDQSQLKNYSRST